MSRFLVAILKFRRARGNFFLFCLSAALLSVLPSASAQDFTLTMGTFTPPAVDPTGTASSNIALVAGTGFTGSVSLACQVTTALTSVTAPECQVSPTTVQPSGSATVTILTQFAASGTTVSASPGTYTVTVTGTGPSTTQQAAQPITVLAVNPAFTLTIQTVVLPKSVTAGNGAVGTVSINPVFGYTGGIVTLSCASVTPLVTIPPQCVFTYPTGQQGQPVNGSPVTVPITINTFGPISNTKLVRPPSFYALWLPLPMLVLTGLGAATGGKRSRKAWGILALFILSGSILLLPACGDNLVPSKITPNGVTPNDTYTFTLMGVDQNGNVSSNTGTASTAPTVTLTVN
jgi:hypothetical protein